MSAFELCKDFSEHNSLDLRPKCHILVRIFILSRIGISCTLRKFAFKCTCLLFGYFVKYELKSIKRGIELFQLFLICEIEFFIF